MNFTELTPYFVMAVIVMIIVSASIFGVGSLLLIRQFAKRELMPLVFWLIGLVIIIGPIQSGRNLSGLAMMFEADIEDYANTLWINRFVSLSFLVIAAERILRWILTRETRSRYGLSLLLALVLFSLTNHFLNAWLGTVSQFSHHAIYAVMLAVAAYLVANDEHLRSLLAARNVVFTILILSALAAVVKPQMVLQSGYSGGYMSIRYWGLGTHANVLGPIIVLLIGVLMVHPFKRNWLTVVAFVLATASLVATQSKTSLLGAVVVVAVLLAYRYSAGLEPRGLFVRPLIPALFIAASMLLITTLLVLQVGFDISSRIERFLSSATGSQVVSFSNRDLIWAHALSEWRENPWFGYGPGIFDAAYRLNIGLRQAFHAHNQFMQSLGAAGNFGVLGLVVYAVTLGFYALRAARASQGLSLAIFAFIAIRSMTEIPLTLRAASSAEFLIHMTLFMMCIGSGRIAVQTREANRLGPQHWRGLRPHGSGSA